MSPYQALFGQCPTYIHYQAKDSANHVVDAFLLDRESHMQVIKANLLKSQQRMKVQADKHRSERSFAMGDGVFLKLQPYRQQSVQKKGFSQVIC